MLTGTWRGTYRYDPNDYPDDPDPVTFVLSLTEHADGRIEGSVQDSASEGGSPESGQVLGERRGSDVLFSKIMPVYYMSYHDGLVDLATWIRVEHQHEVDPADLPPCAIDYSGTIDPAQRAIDGVWTIVEHEVELPCGGFVDLGTGCGTFTMEKVSNEVSDVTGAFGGSPQELKVPSIPVVNSTERMFEPGYLRVEGTGTRTLEPCPCCRGNRRVHAGHVYFGAYRMASFLVYTTDGAAQHDVDCDVIFAEGDQRYAVSLIESDTDGVATVALVDAQQRPIADSVGPEQAMSAEEIIGTEWELQTMAVWQAIRPTR